ncbi:MAG: histidine kinase [Novosphingobium sp.]|uniref:sensor histidine kinase n=1 Tax=Novosphingobium sp. TaxID=1874826 RepID=UPI001DA2563F|nr:histidine kinase [Novosphingobium sp.]MCB2057272.1 histidine kinase [Novosphingobium sp.]MCP5387128.1 histidine kinase [Novosphingobium sp.]
MNQDSASLQRVPARLVLASIIGVWLAFFVLASLRGWLVGLELLDSLLWRRAVVTLASMAVTMALWPILRLLDSRPVWQKAFAVLAISLPASLLLGTINQRVFAPVEAQVVSKIAEREGLRVRRDESGNLLVDPVDRAESAGAAVMIDKATDDDNRWRQLVDLALNRYFVLLAWAALYYALVSAEQARAAERREGEYRRAAKAAELRSLRYQVNPHFLFNTLNSLSALVMTGKAEAAETMIQTLSNFYRRSLAGDPTGDVALEQEFALQQLYLQIEAVRFPERLKVRCDLPDALGEASVPGMILQPLVENSVRYGVAPVTRAVTVSLTAREEYGRLVIEVSDDGPGGSGSGGGFGIGLANVRDRLAASYGEDASLVSGPSGDGGWRSVIRMPLNRHG